MIQCSFIIMKLSVCLSISQCSLERRLEGKQEEEDEEEQEEEQEEKEKEKDPP